MINRRNECGPPWQLGNDVRREGMREGYAKPWLAVIRGKYLAPSRFEEPSTRAAPPPAGASDGKRGA